MAPRLPAPEFGHYDMLLPMQRVFVDEYLTDLNARGAALRAGYARLVAAEVFRVIEGKSTPQPTCEDEPMSLDVSAYQQGVPELVAAELVRDVVEPKEFHEFCQYDCLTVKNGDKYYRIPRRPHGLIEV